MKPTLINRIFRYKSLKEQEKSVQMKLLARQLHNDICCLVQCEKIVDFITLHKQLAERGVHVQISLNDQQDDYREVPVMSATPEHYWCGSYDRDSTYHGTDMLKFEKDPTPDDYDYFSYARAWSAYYSAIYKAIVVEDCQNVHYPNWFINIKTKKVTYGKI